MMTLFIARRCLAIDGVMYLSDHHFIAADERDDFIRRVADADHWRAIDSVIETIAASALISHYRYEIGEILAGHRGENSDSAQFHITNLRQELQALLVEVNEEEAAVNNALAAISPKDPVVIRLRAKPSVQRESEFLDLVVLPDDQKSTG